MYKEILKSIENVAIWPQISLIIFFSFFVLLLWNVLTADKKFISYMEKMPLNPDALSSGDKEVKSGLDVKVSNTKTQTDVHHEK
jgi:cytochrome c oxidase cbb3-type subunit 4